MRTYTVAWPLEIDAMTPEEAVLMAQALMRDQVTRKHYHAQFEVTDEDGKFTVVDCVDGKLSVDPDYL
jgi:penicillin V acylase-like amidase (Ntn superfamily)